MIKKILQLVSIATLLAFPMQAMSDYVFSAPPRESLEVGIELYKPVADYLSTLTGEKFVYVHPENWAEYGSEMQNNKYDLAFDGPHFVSWRIQHLNHDVIVKLPQLHIWRIIARADSDDIKTLEDLVGRKVCAPKSPNFGMLTMMSHYTNPDREPVLVVTKSWEDGFNGVVSGKCDATILPKTNHMKFDPDLSKTKSLHTHLPYPNQAFTAAPSLSPALKAKIKKGLLSEEGQEALLKLRKRYTQGENLVGAENEEYEGIYIVLKRAGNFLSTGGIE